MGKVMLTQEYNVVANIFATHLRYIQCGYFLPQGLYVDDYWDNMYSTIMNTGDDGSARCDSPWEISLAYAEKSFIYQHSQMGAWPSGGQYSCPRVPYDMPQWGGDIDIVFQAYET